MSLVLTTRTEGLTPVGGHDVAAHVRCDRCGEPLRPEAGGRVLWEPDRRQAHLEVAFYHPTCAEEREGEAGTELRGMELADFLSALVHNLEVAG